MFCLSRSVPLPFGASPGGYTAEEAPVLRPSCDLSIANISPPTLRRSAVPLCLERVGCHVTERRMATSGIVVSDVIGDLLSCDVLILVRLSSRHNMVSFGRYALCSLFLFSFDMKSVTIFNLERRLQRPSQNRTCGFPTSGSSVNLTSQAIACTSCERSGAAAAGSAPGTL